MLILKNEMNLVLCYTPTIKSPRKSPDETYLTADRNRDGLAGYTSGHRGHY